MSRLAEIFRLFSRCITAGFVFSICNSVGVFLQNVNSKHELGIYIQAHHVLLNSVSHMKRVHVGEIKKLYNYMYSSQSAAH